MWSFSYFEFSYLGCNFFKFTCIHVFLVVSNVSYNGKVHTDHKDSLFVAENNVANSSLEIIQIL